MNVVWGDSNNPQLNAAFAGWLASRLGMPLSGPCTTMGVMDGDELIAVVMFHNFTRAAGVIEISAAATSKRWLNRHTLWEMFAYPFNELRCQLVAMRVSERNRSGDRGLPRILTSYGFKRHFIPRLRGRDEGEFIFTLSDDDWKANGFHRR